MTYIWPIHHGCVLYISWWNQIRHTEIHPSEYDWFILRSQWQWVDTNYITPNTLGVSVFWQQELCLNITKVILLINVLLSSVYITTINKQLISMLFDGSDVGAKASSMWKETRVPVRDPSGRPHHPLTYNHCRSRGSHSGRRGSEKRMHARR